MMAAAPIRARLTLGWVWLACASASICSGASGESQPVVAKASTSSRAFPSLIEGVRRHERTNNSAVGGRSRGGARRLPAVAGGQRRNYSRRRGQQRGGGLSAVLHFDARRRGHGH